MPFGLKMVPPASFTASSLDPMLARISAALEPTFPKPWRTNLEPAGTEPRSAYHSWMQYARPCPVALTRPSDPPMRVSLPVTTPRREWRSRSPSVNWRKRSPMMVPSVPTSGAGMSRLGPMSGFNRYM